MVDVPVKPAVGLLTDDRVDAILSKLDKDDRKYMEDGIEELVGVVMTLFDFLENAPPSAFVKAMTR